MTRHSKQYALFFAVIALLSTCPALFGQTTGPSRQGKVVYLASQNKKKIPFVCDAELVFDDQSSIFTDGKNVQDVPETRTHDEASNTTVIQRGRKMSDGPWTVFHTDFTNRKTTQWASIHGRSFIIPDTLRTINWTLLDESKEVGGMKCQKAKASVHGREYEAWFASEIPLPYGPWKLQGLPGLILEAWSMDGEVSFELKEVQPVLSERKPIAPPSKGQRIDGYANFFALQDRKSDEFAKIMQARVAEIQQDFGPGSSAKINSNPIRIEKTPDM